MSEAAIFTVDKNGTIISASKEVDALWNIESNALIGDRFVNLFAFEVLSNDPDMQDAQWSALVETSIAAAGSMTAQPKGARAFEAEVHLQRTADGNAFRATVRKLADVSPMEVTTTPYIDTPLERVMASTPPTPAIAALSENSPLGIFEINFTSGRFFFSPAWKAILGYADHELIGSKNTWSDLLHEEDSAAAPDRAPRATSQAKAQPLSVECRLRRKNGAFHWVHCAAVQVFDHTGTLAQVSGIITDIQERKELEETAIAAEQRLEAICQPGNLGIFELDFERESAWFSSAFKDLFCWQSLAATAETIDDFAQFIPLTSTSTEPRDFFAKLSAGNGQIDLPLTLLDATKELRDFRLIATCQRDRRKNLTRITGAFVQKDPPTSSAEKSPIASIKISNEAIQAFNAIPQAVVVIDENSFIVFANEKASALLARPSNELLGKDATEILTLVHRYGRRLDEHPVRMALSYARPTSLNDEHSLLTIPGTAARRITFSCEPLCNSVGAPIGATFVFRDPEEMSLTPNELVRSNRFETLGLLAGGLAHDFNNLLTTILGGISLARENHNYTQLEDSEKGCIAAKALTRQLLSLARGGADLRQILNTSEVIELAVRLSAVGSSVKSTVKLDDGLHMIHAEKAEITRVIQNLVINAIQAMPDGQGSVAVAAKNETLTAGKISALPAGDYVRIDVQDTGTGIPPENLARIFEPFYTTKKTGTGLGLATVLSIIKTHSGHITVDSKLGVGTTFTIYLPRADQPVAEIQREAPMLRFGTGRVLVVDDEEKILELAGIMLESLDYKFDLAKNATEALTLYQRYLTLGRPYDCVILDLTLVGSIGGEEIFREMQKLDPQVCAILSSGYDSDEIVQRYMQIGFRDCLSKPYRIAELGKCLKKILPPRSKA